MNQKRLALRPWNALPSPASDCHACVKPAAPCLVQRQQRQQQMATTALLGKPGMA